MTTGSMITTTKTQRRAKGDKKVFPGWSNGRLSFCPFLESQPLVVTGTVLGHGVLATGRCLV